MMAQEIFRRACGYLSQQEAESEELAMFAPAWLDTLVAEALPYENSKRRLENLPEKPELLAAPRVEALDDDIPYCEEICRVALPYGLASLFFLDDDNQYAAQDFRARYLAALDDTLQMQEEAVVDAYA